MENLQSLAITGVILSLVVEMIKKYFKTSPNLTLTAVVVLSLVIGAIYYQFSTNVALWEAVGGILMTANSFYGLIIKRFEK